MITTLIAIFLFIKLSNCSEVFEYEALYDLEKHSTTDVYSTFTINLGKKSEAYAENTMKLYIQNVVGTGAAGIEEAEDKAETAFTSTTPFNMTTGQTYDSTNFDSNNGTLLQFLVDNDSWISLYKIKIRTAGHYAIFCEHKPSEFVDDVEFGFIHEEDGHAVRAEYVGGTTTTDDDKPWRLPLLATFIASLPSFIGILVFAEFIFENIAKSDYLSVVHAFTSGVLIATAAFLLLPEGLHMIEADYTDISESTAVWGTIICGAILIAYIVQFSFGRNSHSTGSTDTNEGRSNGIFFAITNGNNEIDNSDNKSNPKNLSFLGLLTSGDLLCNFIDGIFIGIAFTCSDTFGWTVTGITVLHELPQEIGDFIALVTIGGATKVQSLIVNAITGLSAMLGCVVYLYGHFSDALTGSLLVYGAANFLFCGMNEMPIIQFDRTKIVNSSSSDEDIKLENKIFTTNINLLNIFAFAFGIFLIGLVLLEHDHCETSSSTSGDGHGH